MAEALDVKIRETRGTSRARRQRAAGSIPAILYGHGKASVSLTVPTDQMVTALRHGSHLVELRGEVTDSALIKHVQWDTFGHDVLHVDFTRVEAGESVEITLSVELRGLAPGTKAGGILDHRLHEIELECPATEIPEKIEVNVNHLQLGQAILASQLPIPAGAKLLTNPDDIVVQCIEPLGEIEVEAAEGTGAEPEIIGRKPEEEETKD